MAAANPKRRKKKRHPNWPVRLILLAIALSFLVFAVFVPVFRFRYSSAYHYERWDYLTELLLTHSMAWFISIWVFFFGTCLGSFLNVVAYRIPSGLTILGSSRCPFCMVSIERRHNFPILGWFMLRGRCAACRLPISPRYFIVEIIAGLLLVWLFVFELVADGKNLPSEHTYKIEKLFRKIASGDLKDIATYDWSLVRIFFVHTFVAYTLLTGALMRLDKFRMPQLWQTIHLAIVWTMIAIWPGDFEFVRTDLQPLDENWPILNRIDIQLMGMIAGIFLGLQFCQLSRDGFNSGILFSFMLMGSCFGIIATFSAGIIFILLSLVSKLISLIVRRENFFYGNPMFLVLPAFLIQIAFWKKLDAQNYWPGKNASTMVLVAYLLFICVVFGLADGLFRRKENIESESDDEPTEEDSDLA